MGDEVDQVAVPLKNCFTNHTSPSLSLLFFDYLIPLSRQYYRCTRSKQEGRGWCGYVIVSVKYDFNMFVEFYVI